MGCCTRMCFSNVFSNKKFTTQHTNSDTFQMSNFVLNSYVLFQMSSLTKIFSTQHTNSDTFQMSNFELNSHVLFKMSSPTKIFTTQQTISDKLQMSNFVLFQMSSPKY